jgi:hypothetical protein
MTLKAFNKRWAQFADKEFGGFNDMPDKTQIYNYLLWILNDIDDFLISYEIDNVDWSGGDTIFIKYKPKISIQVAIGMLDFRPDEFHPAHKKDVGFVSSLKDVFPKDLTNWYRLWWD